MGFLVGETVPPRFLAFESFSTPTRFNAYPFVQRRNIAFLASLETRRRAMRPVIWLWSRSLCTLPGVDEEGSGSMSGLLRFLGPG